jgi:hypothetical protein
LNEVSIFQALQPVSIRNPKLLIRNCRRLYAFS